MTELDDKTERLARLAKQQQGGGVLITTQPGFAWLSCGGTNGIDRSREKGNGALFVRHDGRRFVIANGIEMPRLLEEELQAGEWEPLEHAWTDEQARPALVVERARAAAGGHARILADAAAPGAVPAEDALNGARVPLHADEIARCRRLGADVGAAVGAFCRTLRPGLEEREVARGASDVAAGIGGRSIVTLVAADERLAKFRHPVPTSHAWSRVLMLVMCVERQGLVVALTRIVAAGPAPDGLRERTRACAAVFARMLAATRPGAAAADLFATARAAYEDAGFPGEERLHHQGGAIGYRSRDWIAHPASAAAIHARQAFAWNPSITGTKVEDTALLLDDGIELITTTPGWPTIDVGTQGAAADVLVL